MQINQIHLKNFKGFEDNTFQFNPQFNVLIGDNGTGKTAILDALAVSVSSYVLGIGQAQARGILKEEVRRQDFGDSLEPQLPVIISTHGEIESQKIQWQRVKKSLESRTTVKEAKQLIEIAKSHNQQVSQGKPVILPVISYHGTGRLWKERRQTLNTRPKASRMSGYFNSLEPVSNSKIFLEWFKTMEIAAIQKKIETTRVEVVKEAIINCIPDLETVFFDVIEDTLASVKIEQDKRYTLHYDLLSDGFKNMIGMVADIAYRCVTLNPHLNEQALYKTNGIVLIDEIDLHLHPKWQKRIINDFKRTFPRIQFIVTTHSPFIVQSLQSDEVINLDKATDSDFFRKSIEEIAERDMGVPDVERSQRFKDMMTVAQRYYQLLEEGKKSENDAKIVLIKAELDELSKRYSDDPAYTAFLNMERLARLGQ
ncbi:MAG: AAA family ATPase [Candidatus Parabeggiatoa sp. nov. 3]|nr:MAG: AAA family ATPase [Gammaproteobacteria bacterium]RKZ90261.1 MAG: AAA family ATPase [Gammaproteobacteria bacterium]